MVHNSCVSAPLDRRRIADHLSQETRGSGIVTRLTVCGQLSFDSRSKVDSTSLKGTPDVHGVGDRL